MKQALEISESLMLDKTLEPAASDSAAVYEHCLRFLGDPHAAEDAAQAVFIVLMRKAATLPQKTVLAAWLFTAAYHCARQRQRSQQRRAKHERKAVEMNANLNEQSRAWADVPEYVNDALNDLPEKQPSAVLLRYFQGKTEAEAAPSVLAHPPYTRLRQRAFTRRRSRSRIHWARRAPRSTSR